jgi:hypothetical protein
MVNPPGIAPARQTGAKVRSLAMMKERAARVACSEGQVTQIRHHANRQRLEKEKSKTGRKRTSRKKNAGALR